MYKSTRRQLATLGLLAASLPAFTAAPEGQETDDLEVAVVTGSRIPRVPLDTPNPVMSFDSENIVLSGRTNLTDLLTQAPALVGSLTSYDSAGSQATGFGDAGINLLNLRNLGTERTLVLVNGRRHIAGMPGIASVDINTIPVDLLDRIDVLTGGVSAIYGADGVSGVVNFVTKRDFEGLAIRGQAGISDHGDADNRFVSITGGKNFLDDRANVALSYEYNTDRRVRSFDRARTGDPLRTYGLVRNPADDPDDPNVFDRVLLNNLRYADSSRDGAIDTDWDFVPNFTGSGTAYDLGTSLPSSGGLVQGGSSTPLAGYQGDMQPGIKRHALNLFGDLEINDRLRLFAEAKYVKTDSYTQSQPSFDFFTYISAENPFMPAVIKSAIVPGAAGDYGLSDGVLLSRDNFDIGTRGEFVKRETLRSVLGLDGALADHARYEVSYTYGETAAHFVEQDYRIKDRYFAALDAVDQGQYLNGIANGNIVCRIDLDPPGSNIDPANYGQPAVSFTPGTNSGCSPLNLFGEYVASEAAQGFATADVRNRSKVSHHVVSGSINGDFGQLFALPGGPVGYAIGGEYRKEKSSSVPDQLIQDGLLSDLAKILPESGSFDVKELFAEINLPVLRDAPFAHLLSFGAAARISDYSTVGNTTTWKVDARYAPIRDILFRGTYSEAVRAPNITELFAPTGGGFFFIDDPCDPTFLGDGSQFRAANCTALLTDMGVDPGTFNPESDPANNASISGTATGNPLLKQERAKTWTIGVLFRPEFAPGLSMSFDWYDIKLKNAINTASAEEFAQLCVDQPTLDNVYCDAITRDSGTGFINGWTVRPENVAGFATSGADFALDYRFAPVDAGSFHLTLHGGYLDKLTFISTPGADVDSDRGEQSAPKYLATMDLGWERDGWSANYGINYFSKTRRFTTEELAANPDLSDPRFFFYKAKWEHDLRVGFTPDGSPFSVYAGVNNLFDAQPAAGVRSYPVSFVGRFMYAGFSLKMDRLP
ncbi:MAG: TonB-dependent receptor [Steroidobacteraceae bacterium]